MEFYRAVQKEGGKPIRTDVERCPAGIIERQKQAVDPNTIDYPKYTLVHALSGCGCFSGRACKELLTA